MSEQQRLQQQGPIVASMDEIDGYVKGLQQSYDGTARAPPLTVEHILHKVYTRFYNQKGQSPFPDGLPFALKQLPSLASLAMLQSRLTVIIQSAVATRPVVTVHELECEVCLTENVTEYSELGLGCSLAALPFVQHTFNINGKLKVAPVTSRDFLQFLLFDADAQIALNSGGDAGDAVRAFSRRYMGGKYTSMQLGIHVQHFSWLLHFVRQEVGRMNAFFTQLQSENMRACGRNAVMYTRVVESLHASLMLKNSISGTSSSPMLEFVVHASAAEAMATDVPPALWGTCTGFAGGLSLHGALQAEPFSSCSALAEVAKVTPSALPKSSCSLPAPDISTLGQGSNVKFSQVRKRRRVVVVDEQTEVESGESVSPLPLCVPSQVMAGVPSLPLLSHSIPLEGVASVLRCLAVMQFTGPATWVDFTAFRKCTSQVLSRMRVEGGRGGEATGYGITTQDAKNPFSVDLDTLLSLLSSHGAPEKLYELYCTLASNRVGDEEDGTPPGYLLLQCIELGLQELLFVPLVGTDSLLPLSAARGVLCGRVLLSGSLALTDLLAFHPLHLIFDLFDMNHTVVDDSDDVSSSLVAVDATVLFSGMCSSLTPNEWHHQQQKILSALESCGVLLRVPEEWLSNGFLLQLLQRSLRRHRKKAPNDNVKECFMAFRMLLLYWWLLGVWCEAPTSQNKAVVEEFLNCLRDTPWIPCLSRHRGASDVCVVGWCAPSELFPSLQCFITDGLSELLRFSPNDINDVLLLASQQEADNRYVESNRVFLEKWVSAVQRRILDVRSEPLALLLGMPVTYTASVALRVLCSLQVGQIISLATLRSLLLCIQNQGTEEDLMEAKQKPFIPLPDASCFSITLDKNTFVVGEVATCKAVCWDPLINDANGSSVEDDKKKRILSFFNRSIRFVGDDLRAFFLEVLGISPVPTVETWLAAARMCKRHAISIEVADASITEICLYTLSYFCLAQYSHLLKTLEQKEVESQNNVAQAALTLMVDCAPMIGSEECIFPLDGHWRRVSDGLFFCSPYYYGVDGLALQAAGNRWAPAVPVLMFEQQPHYVVVAILRKWGLLALEDFTEKIVTFGRMNAASAAALHQRIAGFTPLLQQYLRATHPKYYSMVQKDVQKRLENFKTVLGAMYMIREVLHYRGHTYVMARALRYRYVLQHNCLYSSDEEFTNNIEADAIADVFLPFSDAEVRRDVVCVLQEWLQANNHCMVDNAVSSRGMPKVSLLPVPDNEVWRLSAAPAERFREHFPLGRDGFGPVGRISTASAASQAGSAQLWSVKLSAWGNNSHIVRSLPQWSCKWFDSAYDVLRDIRRGPIQTENMKSNTLNNNNNNYNDDDNDEDESDCDTANGGASGAKRGMVLSPKRLRRGGRPRHTGPAMLMPHEPRETHDYAIAAERFVAEMLRAEAPPDVEVVWVNEHGERGTPYDILVVRRSPNASAGHERETRRTTKDPTNEKILAYVEVKSTCTNARRDFEMSLRELLFAARFGGAYKIYRVFRASTSVMRKMQVEVLQDLVTLWRNGEISMTGDVKVVPTSMAQEEKGRDQV